MVAAAAAAVAVVVVVVTLFPTKYMKTHICTTHLQLSIPKMFTYTVSGAARKSPGLSSWLLQTPPHYHHGHDHEWHTMTHSRNQYCSHDRLVLRIWDSSSMTLRNPGSWFNIKMTSYQYRKSHCGDKTILRPSYLHNGISYTGKTSYIESGPRPFPQEV